MTADESNLSSNEQTLSERLRDCVKVTFSAGLHGVESDCRQAAEELDRQRAEIERLARENEDFLDERQRRIHEILRLRAALDSLLTALNFRDSGERLFAVYGMPAIDAANAAAALLRDGCPPVETGNDPGVILKELWSVCRVVFYPDMGDLRGDYPIEHAPGAGKDARALIEARLAERVLQRARTTQKASACPYGQSDCETTRGGVCLCAMPSETRECQHKEVNPIADTHAAWCIECGAFYDGSQWIYPWRTQNG